MNIFMHRHKSKTHLDVDRMYKELLQLSQHIDTMYKELYTSQCIQIMLYMEL
jgi:hypothetical protein